VMPNTWRDLRPFQMKPFQMTWQADITRLYVVSISNEGNESRTCI
jgi:hypothetical protein